MRQKILRILLTSLLIGQLSGCLLKDPNLQKKFQETADTIASKHGFEKSLIKTDPFILTSYQRFETPKEPLVVYIEGDGRSVTATQQISSNPTPGNPVALKLAVLHTNATNVAYLARPCQYTPFYMDQACHPEVWSDARFSEKVIHSINKAIDKLKRKANATEVHLVGFSGGGGVAVLIAARRNDVATLRTVAGDLDHATLSQYHRTPPLQNSLNPRSFVSHLTALPQYHFSAEKDLVVPPFISKDFVNDIKLLGSHCAKRMALQEANHHKGWEENWQELLRMPVDCVP